MINAFALPAYHWNPFSQPDHRGWLQTTVPAINNQIHLPLESLRAKFHAGLVKKRYSPLSLEFVDARAIEAAYRPGAMDEQAVFQVTLLDWGDRALETHGRLEVTAAIHLLDAERGSGEVLWGGTVTRKVDANLERSTGTGPQLTELVVQRFVDDVLASLPPRDPRR